MNRIAVALFAGLLPGMHACTQVEAPSAPSTVAGVAAASGDDAAASGAADAAAMRADPRLVVVHKTPTCGCCHSWVEHLQQSGFRVIVRDADNLDAVRKRVGIPYGMGSCHTGEVAGYFVEGHVPAADIERLLTERPDAKGLTVPGMPIGSPGMEVPSGEVQEYDVHLVARDGSTSVYAHHGAAARR